MDLPEKSIRGLFRNRPSPWPIDYLLNENQQSLITRLSTLEHNQTLERFFAEVERRAFRMAEIATGNREDAFDILQDAMCKLVEKYADHETSEWGPLFQTILQSRIRDWYRRNTIRNRFRSWFPAKDMENSEDPLQTAVDERERTPEQHLQSSRRLDVLEQAIRELPLRQQQAFMLRTLEAFDVKQTAKIMRCSEGSVKTHYSRAVHSLREKLGDHWP